MNVLAITQQPVDLIVGGGGYGVLIAWALLSGRRRDRGRDPWVEAVRTERARAAGAARRQRRRARWARVTPHE